MDVYDKLRDIGASIPDLPKPVATYEPAVLMNDLVFASGQTGKENGKLKYIGKVDKDVSVDEGKESARLAALNCLAEIQHVIGDLNKIRKILKVTGYVASSKDFGYQPQVVEGASALLGEIFGDKGRHARAAVGVAELPFNAPVEIEIIAWIND